METIKTYLENMFMHVKNTPEVEKAKAELLSMMEDKYQELKNEGKSENEAIGIVISEFGNLDELAGELGIEETVADSNETEGIHVSLEEAKQYCKDNAKAAILYGIATMLCVFSPVLLLLVGGLQEEMRFADSIVVAGGLVPLLLLVACGVVMFIVTGISMGKYDKYEKEVLFLDYSTKQFLEAQRESEKVRFALQIAAGVFLCIVSVMPMLIVGSLELESELPSVFTILVMLAIVAVASFLFVSAGVKSDSYHVLLQEEEYAADRKRKGSALHIFDSIYWPVVTFIYLAWSFITMEWHITWIIWPVAGVLSAVIESILRSATQK
ncbi:MAG: hypothetical protein E7289_04095 [Lachnospiraceae bacterium]|nr:hypothetical protein [Lachnospiraceae bacterium]